MALPRRPKGQSGPAKASSAFAQSASGMHADPTRAQAVADLLRGAHVERNDDDALSMALRTVAKRSETTKLKAFADIAAAFDESGGSTPSAGTPTTPSSTGDLPTGTGGGASAGAGGDGQPQQVAVPDEALLPHVAAFAMAFRAHVLHQSPTVRRSASRCLHLLMKRSKAVKSAIGPQMPTIIGAWLCAICDVAPEVQRSAVAAWHEAFPAEKRPMILAKFSKPAVAFLKESFDTATQGALDADGATDGRHGQAAACVAALGYLAKNLAQPAAPTATSLTEQEVKAASAVAALVNDARGAIVEFLTDELLPKFVPGQTPLDTLVGARTSADASAAVAASAAQKPGKKKKTTAAGPKIPDEKAPLVRAAVLRCLGDCVSAVSTMAPAQTSDASASVPAVAVPATATISAAPLLLPLLSEEVNMKLVAAAVAAALGSTGAVASCPSAWCGSIDVAGEGWRLLLLWLKSTTAADKKEIDLDTMEAELQRRKQMSSSAAQPSDDPARISTAPSGLAITRDIFMALKKNESEIRAIAAAGRAALPDTLLTQTIVAALRAATEESADGSVSAATAPAFTDLIASSMLPLLKLLPARCISSAAAALRREEQEDGLAKLPTNAPEMAVVSKACGELLLRFANATTSSTAPSAGGAQTAAAAFRGSAECAALCLKSLSSSSSAKVVANDDDDEEEEVAPAVDVASQFIDDVSALSADVSVNAAPGGVVAPASLHGSPLIQPICRALTLVITADTVSTAAALKNVLCDVVREMKSSTDSEPKIAAYFLARAVHFFVCLQKVSTITDALVKTPGVIRKAVAVLGQMEDWSNVAALMAAKKKLGAVDGDSSEDDGEMSDSENGTDDQMKKQASAVASNAAPDAAAWAALLRKGAMHVAPLLPTLAHNGSLEQLVLEAFGAAQFPNVAVETKALSGQAPAPAAKLKSAVSTFMSVHQMDHVASLRNTAESMLSSSPISKCVDLVDIFGGYDSLVALAAAAAADSSSSSSSSTTQSAAMSTMSWWPAAVSALMHRCVAVRDFPMAKRLIATLAAHLSAVLSEAESILETKVAANVDGEQMMVFGRSLEAVAVIGSEVLRIAVGQAWAHCLPLHLEEDLTLLTAFLTECELAAENATETAEAFTEALHTAIPTLVDSEAEPVAVIAELEEKAEIVSDALALTINRKKTLKGIRDAVLLAMPRWRPELFASAEILEKYEYDDDFDEEEEEGEDEDEDEEEDNAEEDQESAETDGKKETETDNKKASEDPKLVTVLNSTADAAKLMTSWAHLCGVVGDSKIVADLAAQFDACAGEHDSAEHPLAQVSHVAALATFSSAELTPVNYLAPATWDSAVDACFDDDTGGFVGELSQIPISEFAVEASSSAPGGSGAVSRAGTTAQLLIASAQRHTEDPSMSIAALAAHAHAHGSASSSASSGAASAVALPGTIPSSVLSQSVYLEEAAAVGRIAAVAAEMLTVHTELPTSASVSSLLVAAVKAWTLAPVLTARSKQAVLFVIHHCTAKIFAAAKVDEIAAREVSEAVAMKSQAPTGSGAAAGGASPGQHASSRMSSLLRKASPAPAAASTGASGPQDVFTATIEGLPPRLVLTLLAALRTHSQTALDVASRSIRQHLRGTQPAVGNANDDDDDEGDDVSSGDEELKPVPAAPLNVAAVKAKAADDAALVVRMIRRVVSLMARLWLRDPSLGDIAETLQALLSPLPLSAPKSQVGTSPPPASVGSVGAVRSAVTSSAPGAVRVGAKVGSPTPQSQSSDSETSDAAALLSAAEIAKATQLLETATDCRTAAAALLVLQSAANLADVALSDGAACFGSSTQRSAVAASSVPKKSTSRFDDIIDASVTLTPAHTNVVLNGPLVRRFSKLSADCASRDVSGLALLAAACYVPITAPRTSSSASSSPQASSATVVSPQAAQQVFQELCGNAQQAVVTAYQLHHVPTNGKLRTKAPYAAALPTPMLRRTARHVAQIRTALNHSSYRDDVLTSTLHTVLVDAACECVLRLQSAKKTGHALSELSAAITELASVIATFSNSDLRTLRGSEQAVDVIAKLLLSLHFWVCSLPAKQHDALGFATTSKMCSLVNTLAATVLVGCEIAGPLKPLVDVIHRPPVRAMPVRAAQERERERHMNGGGTAASAANIGADAKVKFSHLKTLGQRALATSKSKICLSTFLTCAYVAISNESVLKDETSAPPAAVAAAKRRQQNGDDGDDSDEEEGQVDAEKEKETAGKWMHDGLFPLFDLIMGLSQVRAPGGGKNSTMLGIPSDDAIAAVGFGLRSILDFGSGTSVSHGHAGHGFVSAEQQAGQLLASSGLAVFSLALQRRTVKSLRRWCDGVAKPVHAAVRQFVTRHLTPVLAQQSIVSVLEHSDSGEATFEPEKYDGTIAITANVEERSVLIAFTQDDASANVRFTLPEDYPLRPAQLSDDALALRPRAGVPVEKWRGWMVQVTVSLLSGGSSLWEAVELLCENITRQYDGVEPCPVCYAVVSTVSHKLPDMSCVVCRAKFHGSCLFKWWGNSDANTCPMCRSPWFAQ